MPSIFKRKKVEEKRPLVEPHAVAIRKFSAQETRKYAVNEGLRAVRHCRPGTTVGDILQLDTQATMGNKMTKEGREILSAFRKAANEFCKKHGREPLF